MRLLTTIKLITLVCIISFTSCKEKATTPAKDITAIASYSDVNVATAKQLIDRNKDLIILDVRTPGETAEGMIDGATEIDFRSDNFQNRLSKLDKSKPYLVYCRSGGRSGKCVSMMKEMGFQKAYNLDGGYMRWSDTK